LFTSQFYKWRVAIWESNTLTCCCKQFRSFVLNTLHSISLHSVWQVRSFVDTSFVGDHSFPSLKQSLVPRLSFYFAPLVETAQSSGFTSLPSFRSIRYAPFDPHSLNPFRNPTAASSYGYMHYCQRTLFRLTGRFLSHIPCYSDRQARKTYTT
jgi:hypothetical protein